MAAETSYQTMAKPVVVISPQFLAPYNVDLTITKKLLGIGDRNFGVTDVQGNLLFKIKETIFSIRDRRILLDAAGNPIVSLQQKILTAHKRWQVYRGGSSKSEDLLFSAKKSSMLQFKTQLDIFLASNTKEDVCDFKVQGSYLDRSCTIYAGDKAAIVAQMHKQHTVQSIALGKNTFAVTVYPNVDYAFIVALVLILDEINQDDDD